MITFQDLLRRLANFWEKQGCIIHQGYDLELGAGTMNPATFLRCLGPEPYRAAYVEPCRRPSDGRYGKNPNRTQHYFQYQVIMKPTPPNMQEIYLKSLESIGIDLKKHDIRFVHDDWENPSIGAWGLGWEVWLDGMEITQFTYFQSVGGQPLMPITCELTYGTERILMYLQDVDNFFDMKWNSHLTYGDIYQRSEYEWSKYNFEDASTSMWSNHFEDFEKESKQLIKKDLPIPAYEFVMKASHAFNILDARGAISVTERTGYIGRIRDLAKAIAEIFIESRKKAGFPLTKIFPNVEHPKIKLSPISKKLLSASPDDRDDFLLEIGSEELPATFVPIGMKNLEKIIKEFLETNRIGYESLRVFGTPRRLSILVKKLALALKDEIIEKRGPQVDRAFDTKGNITKAGLGFFSSIDKKIKTLEELKKDKDLSIKDVKGSQYIFAGLHIKGKKTASILAENLAKLILKIDFPKKMRWLDADITYARPLRWIAAILGKEVIPFAIGNIQSGKKSFGHSQLDPVFFEIKEASTYVEDLKKHHVLADPISREKAILKDLEKVEKELKASVICKDEVLKQVVNLVEWPKVLYAEFDSSFLKAPKEVLISEMVEHQKYFPVANADGTLKNYFVITINTNPRELIRKGNQMVLSARLSDGVFLYEKGLNVPFEEYNKKLSSVTYLRGLGTLQDKVIRLENTASILQNILKISSPEKVKRAAHLCKSDLVTEMVFEFPNLQGVVGRYYALNSNEDTEVATAIDEHWMPRGEKAPLPKTETGIVLSIADKIDNLISCFVSNLRPTSSSDPYALRRQVMGIIKILINNKLHLPFQDVFANCMQNFTITNPAEILQQIEQFFINRIKTIFLEYGFAKDSVAASTSFGFNDIYDTFRKVKALNKFRSSSNAFEKLFEVYKRAKGQISNFEMQKFDKSKLVEKAEIDLDTILDKTEKELDSTLNASDYDKAYQLIAKLQKPLSDLYDNVRILADDKNLQNNRIALLQRVFALFNKILDFSKIQ